jgi:hypothetical protein
VVTKMILPEEKSGMKYFLKTEDSPPRFFQKSIKSRHGLNI